MNCGKITITKTGVTITPVNGTVWLSQSEIADLFDCFVSKVRKNISAILKGGILKSDKVCCHHLYGNDNSIELFSLEIIIALSFRIQTDKTEIFRKWIMREMSNGLLHGRMSGQAVIKFSLN